MVVERAAEYRQNKQRAEESRFNFATERVDGSAEVEESFINSAQPSRTFDTTSEVLVFEGVTALGQLRVQAGVSTQREVVDNQRDLTNASCVTPDAVH